MIPSVDTRLSSMVSAMTGTILPALAGGNPFVLEQAQLLAGHLQVLRAQEPYIADFERRQHEHARAHALALLDTAAGGPSTDAARAGLRTLVDAETPRTLSALRPAQAELAAAIAALVSAVAVDGDDTASAVSSLCIAHERDDALRLRAFFAAFQYEDGQTDLPGLDALVTDTEQTGATA